MPYITFLAFGALGGLARGVVGALKSFRPVGNSRSIDLRKLFFNIIGATIIGAVVGIVIDINPVTALASGYAGIDVIDTIMKIKKE